MSVNLLELYPSIQKPISITFNVSREDAVRVGRTLLENTGRLCLLKLDGVSAQLPDGTRDFTVQLLPLLPLPEVP